MKLELEVAVGNSDMTKNFRLVSERNRKRFQMNLQNTL